MAIGRADGSRPDGSRPHSDPRKKGEAMARSEIMQKIEDLSEERERLLAPKGPTTRERATTGGSRT
jgi:hypothetical protein